MKKLILVLLIVFLSVSIHAGNRFMVTVSGNYLVPADGNYKDIYGDGEFFPEIKTGFKIFRDLYVWAGYGYLIAKGTTTSTLSLDAESSQHFISFGTGYIKKVSRVLGLKFELGGFSVNYKEETMGEKVTGSTLGFRSEGGVTFDIGGSVFTEITAGYLKASDTVDGLTIKFGGFKTGIGLGIRF